MMATAARNSSFSAPKESSGLPEATGSTYERQHLLNSQDEQGESQTRRSAHNHRAGLIHARIRAFDVIKGAVILKVLETDRLILRWLSTDDAEFILELLNDPSWLRFIGDKGVRTIEDARDYILKGPVEMYARLGFGLYLTEVKEGGSPIGICGLIKRDSLEDVDIGFAFLPNYRGQGYAYEAAFAAMGYGKNVLGLKRIVAITSTDNYGSAKLLEKLGFQFEKMVRFTADGQELRLFSSDI